MHVCIIKKKTKTKRGQLSIIAALLVATIMVAAVITTYSRIRNIPFQKPPKILGAIDEMNSAIKKILGFTVGYYGSILQVTGNAEYAKTLTSSYLRSGFINLARMYPEWAPSFEIESPDLFTLWFATTSYSLGNVSATYSLPGAGIYNVTYRASSLLSVAILEPLNPDKARIHVTVDEENPDLTLGKNNFFFYSYSYSDSTWETVHPSNDPIAFSNGTYVLDIPPGVDPATYMVKVVDQRGIMVMAFFSQSRRSQYTYTFTWDEEKYGDLTKDAMVVEVLQNGALRWLGQDLELFPKGSPIPPIPVKAFRINQTVNGVNREVPFQVEDWASNYRVPLGLSVNASLFSNKNMIVFLVNHNVSDVTLWWDGQDTAAQTPYATGSNLNDKVFEAEERATLNNDVITVDITYGDGDFIVETATGTAEFMRINGESARYFAAPSFVILNGTVRDIIQQEGEWQYEGAPNSPNVYSQIVLTLPANATYYTYALRTIFVNSSSCPVNRNLSDLNPIQLSSELVSGLQSFTENGTSGGFPLINETIGGQTNLFYNFSTSTGWAHHWSEYISGNNGGGMMFTDNSNLKLYAFDSIAGEKTGALSITTEYAEDTEWITPNVVHDKCGEDGNHPASDAIDGNTGSYWRHDSSCNHWIIFDMGETMKISRIRIYQSWSSWYRWGRDSGIEVYVSDDPENWSDPVWEGTEASDGSGWQPSGEFSAEGRYVKLYSKSSSDSQRMYEIEIARADDRQSVTIEFNPVERFAAAFTDPKDITWYGAVVTFTDGYDPIWADGDSGLWVMVEYPPTVSVG